MKPTTSVFSALAAVSLFAGEHDADSGKAVVGSGKQVIPSGKAIVDVGQSLGGTVFYDTNNNRVKEEWEMGPAGFRVNLRDSEMEILDTTITNQFGYYQFNDVAAGVYHVTFGSQKRSQLVTVVSGQPVPFVNAALDVGGGLLGGVGGSPRFLVPSLLNTRNLPYLAGQDTGSMVDRKSARPPTRPGGGMGSVSPFRPEPEVPPSPPWNTPPSRPDDEPPVGRDGGSLGPGGIPRFASPVPVGLSNVAGQGQLLLTPAGGIVAIIDGKTVEVDPADVPPGFLEATGKQAIREVSGDADFMPGGGKQPVTDSAKADRGEPGAGK